MFLIWIIVFEHLSTAPISACAELCAVYVWRLDTQSMGPPSQTTCPAMDRLLKRSRRIGLSSSFCTDWFCGPQFASVRPCSCVGSSGNWTNDSMWLLFRLLNFMPSFWGNEWRIYVAWWAVRVVLGYDVCYGWDIWSSLGGKPIEAAYIFLENLVIIKRETERGGTLVKGMPTTLRLRNVLRRCALSMWSLQNK